jgi:hypothetical protein
MRPVPSPAKWIELRGVRKEAAERKHTGKRHARGFEETSRIAFSSAWYAAVPNFIAR